MRQQRGRIPPTKTRRGKARRADLIASADIDGAHWSLYLLTRLDLPQTTWAHFKLIADQRAGKANYWLAYDTERERWRIDKNGYLPLQDHEPAVGVWLDSIIENRAVLGIDI